MVSKYSRPVSYFFIALTITVLTSSILPQAFAATYDTGGATPSTGWASQIYTTPFTAPATGPISAIAIDVYAAAGHASVAIYSDSSGSPNSKLGGADNVAITTTGWVNVATGLSVAMTSGIQYWLALATDTTALNIYFASGATKMKSFSCCGTTLPDPFGTPTATTYRPRFQITYSTGPGLTLAVTTTNPLTVGATSTGTFTISVTYTGGLSGTVNLAVGTGCPTGVTCTLSQTSFTATGTSTLTVPTLISTSGTFPVQVLASGVATASVTATLIVQGPASYAFMVRTGATQVVCTVMWTGAAGGSASVNIGPGYPNPSPIYDELGAVVYDRISITAGTTPTYSYIHRVTFTFTATTTPQQYTCFVSIATTSYTVYLEVS